MILAVIFLIFGVLQIILFFKVWWMCDNITIMRKEIKSAEDYVELAKLQVYLNNKEKAKELYLCAKYKYENKEKYVDGAYFTETQIKEIDEIIDKL